MDGVRFMKLPARFGRYMLEERLGAGGMAEVYRARIDDAGFPKPVCVKRVLPQLSAQPGFADMMRDEARIAAHLNHQNLVQSLDFGEVDGVLYMAMELVDGVNLQDVLEAHQVQGEQMPIPQALHIALCVSRALAHAHAATSGGKALSIVHRDVSPQNVLLGVDGAVKLADFGVAHASERLARTTTGEAKGKPAYMAPEQVTAEPVDQRADQFALGIVLWEMLAGRRLFAGASILAVMDAVANLAPPPLSSIRGDVPPSLDAVVARMLSRAPDRRFRDMIAVERAIATELAGLRPSPADVDPRRLVELARDAAEDTVRLPTRRPPGPDPTLEETAPHAPTGAPYRNAPAPGGSAERALPAPGGPPLSTFAGPPRVGHPVGLPAVGALLGVVVTAMVAALVVGRPAASEAVASTPAAGEAPPPPPPLADALPAPVPAPVPVVDAPAVEVPPAERPVPRSEPAADAPKPPVAPTRSASRLEQATRLFLRGEFAEATPLLEAHVKAQPDDAQARRLLDMARERARQRAAQQAPPTAAE